MAAKAKFASLGSMCKPLSRPSSTFGASISLAPTALVGNEVFGSFSLGKRLLAVLGHVEKKFYRFCIVFKNKFKTIYFETFPSENCY